MAQTGDVEFGNKKDFNSGRVGTGGSDLPDLKKNLMKRSTFVALAPWQDLQPK